MVKWQKLCEKLHQHTISGKYQFRNEEDLESHYFDYMDLIFGWDYKVSERQRSVQFGHESKRLDLVLCHEGRPTIIFEFKKPGIALCGESVGQLGSYMTQLNTEFGVLTNGVVFQLFYKPLGSRSLRPTRILSIRYDGNNEDGILLGKLLDREKFDEKALKDFCDSRMSEIISSVEKEVAPSQQFIAEQMSEELDKKITEMSQLYKQWVSENQKEIDFIENRNAEVKWIQENVLNVSKLKKLSNREYCDLIHEIPNHLTNLKMGANRTLYANIDGNKEKFVRAIEYLCNAEEEQKISVIKELLENESFRIKGMARSFWSEIVRCRFTDIPLVNVKTEDFFNSIGLQIGFSPEEQVENVYYCYKRWGKLCKNMTINDFSHMEHFVKVAETGQDYIRDNFDIMM